MKKIVLTLLLCLLFALCACGETEKQPPDGGGEDTGTEIALNKTELTVYIGSEEQLLLSNAGGKTVVWKSSDEAVVSVEAEGSGAFVKGIEVGTATVTATVDGKTLTCAVTVKESPLFVFLPDGPTGSFKNGRLVLLPNDVATVKAMSEIEFSGTPAWKSSDESVAAVEFQGLIARVKAVSLGECTVTVECDGFSASFLLLVGKTA